MLKNNDIENYIKMCEIYRKFKKSIKKIYLIIMNA